MIDQPLTLPCGTTLRNRLVKAAMTEGLADAQDRPSRPLERLYARWARGGAGLLITGNVMVHRRYLERPGNVVVEDAAALPALRRLARAGTQHDTHLWAQLSHPGRQTQRWIAPRPVAPSAVPAVKLFGMFGRPRALSPGEIEDTIARFARTASLCQRAGFTGVELHAAHGYLLSQFLSPRSNRRDDAWGGDLPRRARILRETVRAVRAAVGPAFPIAVKLNSADFLHGGLTEDDSAQVARWLVDDGIDVLEVSGGTYERLAFFEAGAPESRTSAREAHFLDFAARVRAASDVPVLLTGGFRTRDGMQDALARGAVDLIGLARPLALDPDLPRKLLTHTADASPAQPIRRWPHTLDALREAGVYGRQLERLARGLDPDPDLPPTLSALRYVASDLAKAWARPRGGRRPPRSAQPPRSEFC